MKQYMFNPTPSRFTYCYNWNILGKRHRWHFLLCHRPDISPPRNRSGLSQENLCRSRRIGHLSVSKNNWQNQFLSIRYISMVQQLSEDKIRHYGSYFLALLDVVYLTREAVFHHMSKHWQESWKHDVDRMPPTPISFFLNSENTIYSWGLKRSVPVLHYLRKFWYVNWVSIIFDFTRELYQISCSSGTK